jgi:hypothetical protein
MAWDIGADEYVSAGSVIAGAGSLAAVSTVAGSGQSLRVGKGTVAALCVFAAVGSVLRVGAGTVTAVSTFSGSGTVVAGAIPGSGTITAVSTFSGTGTRIRNGAGTIAGVATVGGTGIRGRSGVGSVAGVSTLTATGIRGRQGSGQVGNSSIVVNGTFDSATTGWSGVRSTLASIAGGQSGNCLEITYVSGTTCYATQSISGAKVGAIYDATVYVKSGTSGNESYRLVFSDGVQSVIESGTSSGSWVQDTATLTARGTTLTIQLFKMSSVSGTMLFDTVRVTTAESFFIATGNRGRQSTGSFAGTSTVTGTGIRVKNGSGTITGTSTLTGSGLRTRSGVGLIDEYSSFAGVGQRTRPGAGVVTATSTLAGVDSRGRQGIGSVHGVSTLSARGIYDCHGAGAIHGTSTFTGNTGGGTIANKSVYIKAGGAWVQISPTATVTTDADGGTF